MNLRSLSDLFLYELWTLCDAKKQVIAVLLRMSRLASNYELLEELKAHTDQANEQMYLLRTIISSYQAIPPVEDCAAMKGLIASSELLLNNCGAANAGALDAAVICTSLDILHYELAKLERLRLYANLLSDRQTVTILNGVCMIRSRPNIVWWSLWTFASILIRFQRLNQFPLQAVLPPTRRLR